MSFSQQYLSEVKQIVDLVDPDTIEDVARLLAQTRESGGCSFSVWEEAPPMLRMQ